MYLIFSKIDRTNLEHLRMIILSYYHMNVEVYGKVTQFFSLLWDGQLDNLQKLLADNCRMTIVAETRRNVVTRNDIIDCFRTLWLPYTRPQTTKINNMSIKPNALFRWSKNIYDVRLDILQEHQSRDFLDESKGDVQGELKYYRIICDHCFAFNEDGLINLITMKRLYKAVSS